MKIPQSHISKLFAKIYQENLFLLEAFLLEFIIKKELIDSGAFTLDTPEINTDFILNALIQIANALAFLEDCRIYHAALIPYFSNPKLKKENQ